MGTTYRSADVKCPFYKTDIGKNIVCEGFKAGCDTEHKFRRKDTKDKHMKSFCENEYCKCSMYKLLLKKYEGS